VTDVHAFHLPHVHDVQYRIADRHDGVTLLLADLAPADIARICTQLLAAQAELRTLNTSDIIAAIDAVARRLRDPSEPEREAVLASLRSITGYSTAMAEHVLDRMTHDWLAPALHEMIRAEFGGTGPLDGFAARAGRHVRTHVIAPPLGLHVFSGNVPGVAVTSIVRALLVRSAVLGKSAAGEPALAPAFARLLSRVNPIVGNCVAVTYWAGGDTALEHAALQHVSLVVHYGGADAIASLRERASARVSFVEHGPRISFGIVAGDQLADAALLDQIARDTAHSVALFDQQGCVSPQLVYVLGGSQQARVFADAVATAMQAVQKELPRGRIDAGEAAAIRELRTRAEFAAIAGAGGEVWGPDELHFSVILSGDIAFEGSCLNRTLLVKPAPDLGALLDAVRPFGALLQTVGLAGFDAETRSRIAAALADAGATRITSVADMPWPPPAWHHDGRGPLTELVRWTDMED
jgi:hypothetical protein